MSFQKTCDILPKMLDKKSQFSQEILRQAINPKSMPGEVFPLHFLWVGLDKPSPRLIMRRKKPLFFGLEWILEGQLKCDIDGHTFIVEPGEVFVKPIGVPHVYQAIGKVLKYYVAFSGPCIDAMIHTLGLNRSSKFKPENSEKLTEYFEHALHILAQEKKPMHQLASLYAYEFLLYIASCVRQTLYPEQILRAMDYIHSNFRERPNLKKISSHAGTSATQLNRLFHQYLNMSPFQFLINERLDLAKGMLRSTQMPIHSIADTLGYSDMMQFSAQFRQYEKLAPRDYRKQNTIIS